MADAIVQAGTFISNGIREVIRVRSDFDIFRVINMNGAANNSDKGVKFEWRKPMANGTGLSEFKTGATNALNAINLVAPNGFYRFDNNDAISFSPVSGAAAIAFTATSNAFAPVVNTASTAGLVVGSIVRLYQGGAGVAPTTPNLTGIDFQIGAITANTNFTLAYNLATLPGVIGGAGSWRRVDNLPAWRRYYMANVSVAVAPTVTTTTDHYLLVGDVVQFQVEFGGYGMVELEGKKGKVLTVPTPNTFTMDLSTVGFTAFTFPTAAQVLADRTFAPASLFPVEKDIDFIAMVLPGDGATGLTPGGAANDVMYWEAVKSFNQ